MTNMEIAFRKAEVVKALRNFNIIYRNHANSAIMYGCWMDYCALRNQLYMDIMAEFGKEYAEFVVFGTTL